MESEYYPPRARWYGSLFYVGAAVRRRLALDRIQLPQEMTLGGLVAGFLIPGLAVHIRGPRLWGKIALIGCGLLAFSFVVWFGYPAGNFAFGLLLSIHVTGFVYYCTPLLNKAQFQSRVFFTLAVLIALGGFIYAPSRSAMQRYWLMPLRLNGHVIVVQKRVPANSVRRGDWVAYTLSGYVISVHGYRNADNRSGMGLGPVLATAGDSVEFSANAFMVNGIPQPLLPHMPVSGTLMVPENHWFIWPNLAISGHGNVGEADISSAMLQMADVSTNQFVGKPFKRWLWRRQILS